MSFTSSGFVPRKQQISGDFVVLVEKLVRSFRWPRMDGSSPKLKRLKGLDLVERQCGAMQSGRRDEEIEHTHTDIIMHVHVHVCTCIVTICACV